MFTRCLCSASVVALVFSCTPLESTAEPQPAVSEPEVSTPGPSADPDAQSAPEAVPRSAGGLSAVVVPEHAVLAGASGQLAVMVQLTGQGEGGPRPPLDVAIVLDRSGSMGGDKLLAVKQAGIEFVEALDVADAVSLVSYATDVTSHGDRRAADESGKAHFRRELLGMESAGGTALGPALFKGLGMLSGVKRADETLAHVLLLSDGNANEGESDPERIANQVRAQFGQGISTSTLGVGLDYNEDLMTKVADAGGGRYHFVETSEAVSGVLANELAGLSSTVVRGVELDFTAASGGEVERVFGYENHHDGDNVRALVGSLAAQQKRSILAQVSYPVPTGDTLSLGEIHIRYVSVETGESHELILHPRVPVVQNEDEVRKSENVEVTVRAAEIAANEQLRLAAQAIDRRDFDGAKGTLQRAKEELKRQNKATPSEDLTQQIEEFEEAITDAESSKNDEVHFKRSKKKFKQKVYFKGKK